MFYQSTPNSFLLVFAEFLEQTKNVRKIAEYQVHHMTFIAQKPVTTSTYRYVQSSPALITRRHQIQRVSVLRLARGTLILTHLDILIKRHVDTRRKDYQSTLGLSFAGYLNIKMKMTQVSSYLWLDILTVPSWLVFDNYC